MKWAYGVTTVPERFETTLPATIASLQEAGFDKPRLFVDGAWENQLPDWTDSFEATCRYPKVKTVGNWILSLWELYLREPKADRYAVFQDDFITYKNLRAYLDSCQYRPRTYWNLYTFPKNQKLAPDNYEGWYESDQLGKGAVALVFDRSTVTTLLGVKSLILKPQAAKRATCTIDGGIVTALKAFGWKELVHTPSLVQHTGLISSMGNARHALAISFKGQDYDATNLISYEARGRSQRAVPAHPEAESVPVSAVQPASVPTNDGAISVRVQERQVLPVNPQRDEDKGEEMKKTLGLFGTNSVDKCGDLNRIIAERVKVDQWFIVPTDSDVAMAVPDGIGWVTSYGASKAVRAFVARVGAILFVNAPAFNLMLTMARAFGVKTVCLLLDPAQLDAKWADLVDVFIATDRAVYGEAVQRGYGQRTVYIATGEAGWYDEAFVDKVVGVMLGEYAPGVDLKPKPVEVTETTASEEEEE